ncbi:MAG: hypothetical protein JNG86_13000, partial [Verrucomicrobiaceae bacterium]|nr:hypothetical protein [Verrucomicrobiaceae bacterium]
MMESLLRRAVMRRWRALVWGAGVLAAAAQAHAGCCLPVTVENQAALADGVFRGVVRWNRTANGADGRIHTTTGFEVVEVLKGRFAGTVPLRHPG